MTTPGEIRILGLDPGSRITGFGLVDMTNGRGRYVASGSIRTGNGGLPERLRVLFEGVSEVVRVYNPMELAIEQIFMYRNADSALKLGQARGAALCAALVAGLPVAEYMPAVIKQAVVGRGDATKAQVQHMVKALLDLPAAPGVDAADALAVALCHIQTGHNPLSSAGPTNRRRGGWR